MGIIATMESSTVLFSAFILICFSCTCYGDVLNALDFLEDFPRFPVEPPPCEDKLADCKSRVQNHTWHHREGCRSGGKVSELFFRKNCYKSCGCCDCRDVWQPKPKPDMPDASCALHVRLGRCESRDPLIHPWMMKNCQRSCGCCACVKLNVKVVTKLSATCTCYP